MSEAARLQLKAFGKQDTYLVSKNPDKSNFNYDKITTHSEFRKFHRSKDILNPGRTAGSALQPSGQRLSINPKTWAIY